MRTREKNFSDYNLSIEEVNRIKNECRNAQADDITMIRIIANKIYPEIGHQLCESLVNKISYERLCAIEEVPINKYDFYGYRRKLIYAIHCVDVATK